MVDCPFFQSQGEAQRYGSGRTPATRTRLDIEDGVRDGIACSTSNYNWAYPDDRDFNIVAVTTPTPTITPVPVSTPTRAQRVAGAACSDPAFNFSGESAQQFLLTHPNDPLRMDENRDGTACGGADGAGFMPDPPRTSPMLPPPRNYL